MATGQLIQIQGLRHDGIGRSDTTLCAKVLTVPRHFAENWGSEEAQLTTPDAANPNNHLYTRTSRPLQLVIGMDLAHLAPALIDSYRDEHGFVQLFQCSFDAEIMEEQGLNMSTVSIYLIAIRHRLAQFVMVNKISFCSN